VLDYLDDLDADFRVFYRVDDIEQLSGPQFFALAVRVSAYQGVMAARIAEQQDDSSPSSGGEVRQVEATRTAVTADPVLGSLVSWGAA
jgi:hypothetical protein